MKNLILIALMMGSSLAFAFSETSQQAVASFINQEFGTSLSADVIGTENHGGQILYTAKINVGCVLVLEDALIPSIEGGYAHKVTLVGQRQLHSNACPSN